MAKTLFLYDTLSKKKQSIIIEDFIHQPLLVYVCGIPPYDYSHIGHARCYVTYDILVRLMRFFNSKITYIQNITDVNDKIIEKAILKYNDPLKYLDIAEYYHGEFSKELYKIGCLRPDFLPKVSTSMNSIIDFISDIFDAGYAYETNDGVYFNVEKYKDYGLLSYRKKKDISISRIEESHDKHNELDFALWKKNNEKVFWPSPWGNGMPGWHIECSAMIKESFLNQKINIHGGGMDLIFPHHENEKAQTECCKKYKLTDIWMHVAFINVNAEKMSKSLGNCFYIKDILEKYDPMIFRFYLLTHQYNSPIEFNFDALNAAKISYKQIVNFFNKYPNQLNNKINENDINQGNNIIELMHLAILDNLNTASFIGLFFKYYNLIDSNLYLYFKIKDMFKYILGLSLNVLSPKEYTSEIIALLKEREEARKLKNFSRSDEIKKILISLGVSINDKKI